MLSEEVTFLPDGPLIGFNLDPFREFNEVECMWALRDIGRVNAVRGLEACMNTDDLSMGQRQLICLAHAILWKRSKDKKSEGEKSGGLLLLDEISSSVDHETDERIQKIIKTEFEEYTVIAVLLDCRQM